MGDVTALMMDVITEKSGHTITPLAVSVCTHAGRAGPLPIPYPVVGSSIEGISDAPMRTKINGAQIGTVGSVPEDLPRQRAGHAQGGRQPQHHRAVLHHHGRAQRALRARDDGDHRQPVHVEQGADGGRGRQRERRGRDRRRGRRRRRRRRRQRRRRRGPAGPGRRRRRGRRRTRTAARARAARRGARAGSSARAATRSIVVTRLRRRQAPSTSRSPALSRWSGSALLVGAARRHRRDAGPGLGARLRAAHHRGRRGRSSCARPRAARGVLRADPRPARARFTAASG